MDPTPQTPPPGPPAVGQGLVEYIRTNRAGAGSALLGLAGVLVVLAVFLAYKAFSTPTGAKPADKSALEKDKDKEKDKDAAKPGETEAQALNRAQFNLGWIAALGAGLVAAAAGASLMARPPAPDEAGQRAEARVVILAVGGLFGAGLIVLGAGYFYLWSDSLLAWLNRGEVRESRWVLIPLLVVVAGAGLVFAAIQPARAEERNSEPIRKAVYRSNFALTVLLLLVTLVVANVAFALKVPNKLDTTATGFYSLSDTTKDLLGRRLKEQVNAYALIPEGSDRLSNDVRQLLLSAEDASGGKFKVKFLSETANKVEIAGLQKRYPQLDLVLNQRGMMDEELPGAVLLTVGEGENRHSVIPAREFAKVEGRQVMFEGEARLFKEVAFLADSETRPVVYFTQGHGELALDPGPAVRPERAAGRLKTYLENNYLSVRPLDLTKDNPAVPDDAAIVVVADPTTPLSDAAAGTLRKYMTGAKKGKMVVLAGAEPGPDRKVARTGLEPMLTDLNVRLGNRFIFTIPTQEMPYADTIVAAFAAAAEQNPILQAIIKVSPRMRLVRAREVEPLTTAPALQATDLMLSTGPTWLEDEYPGNLRAALSELLQTPKVQEAKGLSRSPRPVAAIVSEGQTSRAVVIGCSYFVSDEAARQSRAATAPLSFDLVGMSVDWLRERPSIAAAGVEAKKYTEYRFPLPAAVDDTRLKYVPLGLAMLTVVGLGVGVWVSRRQ